MQSNTTGYFITVEGIEGAGKTTHLHFIQNYLEKKEKKVVLTREPGGTPLGEHLRGLLLGHQYQNIADDTELLLMFAARAQHLKEIIQPNLNKGKVVLCDRFTDATYAYQGGGRGISEKRIRCMEDWVQQGLKPHLTFLLDLPVEVGLKRAGLRSTPDRFESETINFFEKVRATYLELAEQPHFIIIDANCPLIEVQQQIQQSLDTFFVLHHSNK